jgi:DNA primase
MAYIKKEFIDRLIADSDIVQVFSAKETVVRKGINYTCKSPYTDEKTASCMISPKMQIFKDFSTGKSGNVITYLMYKNNSSFIDAVEELAKMQGKTVEYEKPEIAEKQKQKQAEQKDLRKYLEAISLKFQEELNKLPKDHPAWQEINKRKYTDTEVKFWELGYAPGNGFMYQLFSDFGAVDIGKKLGLINDKNQDKLWEKLIYPIYDDRSKLIGFASRQLNNDPNFAKWMNPSENDLYHKSNQLFGLHLAKTAILKENRVFVTEGYNDVIAWHKNGLENTVGICGTAFTVKQMEILKKLCSKVTLCLDGDKAGKAKVTEYVQQLLKVGFGVEVVILPGSLDPDDYSRKFKYFPKVYIADGKTEKSISLEETLQVHTFNGFEYLLTEKIQGDELDRNNGVKEIVKTIANINDAGLQNIYTEKLTKVAKLKPAVVKMLFKEQEAEKVKVLNSGSEKYQLPKGITMKIEDIEPIVEKYELLIDNNQIYMVDDMSWPIYFRSVSNFSIDILQHMNDDKFAKKLLSVCNVKGQERIFDVPANTFNAPQRFKDVLADQGNYRFDGNQKDLDKLYAYLADNMGIGRKIDVLGWNPEGFYCWNNSVTIPGKNSIPVTKDGIFHHEGDTYYVPSANEIYKSNPYKYSKQKKIVLKSASFNIEDFLAQVYKVHKEFAIPGILFAFATAHQDVIFEAAKGFPIFFLFGPASTGKDQLFSCIKRMYGLTETDLISLENGLSTGKGKIRTFAETSNMVVHLSEFTNGMKDNVGMLKELWGRNGYTRGSMDSAVSTDTVPILSSTMVTGNEYPTDSALLSRLVFGEMYRNTFNEQEVEEYKKLAKMLAEPVTSFIDKVIWHRGAFEENFLNKFNLWKKTLSARKPFDGAIDRIITNYAVLGATYDVLRDVNAFPFPFSMDEMLKTFDSFATNLRSKISSASIFIKFWDLFILRMRGNTSEHIREYKDFRLEGDILSIQFTNVFTSIQKEWFPRFSESCPGKKTFQDGIKSESYFIGPHKVKMEIDVFENGKLVTKSTSASVYQIDLNKIPEETKENIENTVYWQRQNRNSNGDLFNDSPATPNLFNGEEENSADSQLVFKF